MYLNKRHNIGLLYIAESDSHYNVRCRENHRFENNCKLSDFLGSLLPSCPFHSMHRSHLKAEDASRLQPSKTKDSTKR